ncbi:hypothetical protein M413DRAFT_447667 [Hebeloma cylindrosporum]|uniref:histone deacetylase n=1 Tax=Hebeloma cylindrosporum TaxID=76867 RepID=A0A0C3BQ07_HEBCY|nr:hypothetical protein M413DRAFT_447667 [Hebeloma cylindrosporum h7]
MSSFHTDEYVHFLHGVTPETAEKLTYSGTRFLVGEDNPAFDGVFEFCSISAGGSIGAAQRITSGAADIAINWAGGLHHAKKREASGFCYINDIVLGILELLRTYPRVLYIDIDCHHGDGVEEAFYTTNRVMTCSFHKFGEYFPGTGSQEDKGRGKGKGYAVNVPLKDGITDDSFRSVFEPVIPPKTNIPLILLGGGGYTVKNVARTWTYETACALGMDTEIDPNLPWNPYFEWFGPRYRLEVLTNNMDDLNVKDGSIDGVREAALQQLQELPCAPSVPLQDVPRESLRQHLGFGKDDEEARDELDERLAQHTRYLYDLQEDIHSSEESDAWDSDESASNARRGGRSVSSSRETAASGRKKRISLLTGQYFDVADHHDFDFDFKSGAKRRFFPCPEPRSPWEDMGGVDDAVASRMGVVRGKYGGVDLSVLMERGGRDEYLMDEGHEDEEPIEP